MSWRTVGLNAAHLQTLIEVATMFVDTKFVMADDVRTISVPESMRRYEPRQTLVRCPIAVKKSTVML